MPRRQLRYNNDPDSIIERRRTDVWQMGECQDKMKEVVRMLEAMTRRSPEHNSQVRGLINAAEDLERRFHNAWEALRDDPLKPDDFIE